MILKNILLASCAEVMWFVRVLIVFVILSPIIYFIINLTKKNFIFIFLIYLVCAIIFKFDNMFYWLPMYLLGAYFGMIEHDKIERVPFINKKREIILPIMLFTFYIIMFFVIPNIDKESFIRYIYVVFAPVTVFLISDCFSCLYKAPNKFFYASFFIFAIHNPILQLVRELLFIILGFSPVTSIIVFILTVLFTLLIVYIIYEIMNKYFNKILKILTGSR